MSNLKKKKGSATLFASLLDDNDKRENMCSVVSDCTSLFNWFSILVWETLMKGEEIIREAGKVGLMCQQISGEFLNILSTQTQRHKHTDTHAYMVPTTQ